MKKNEIFFGGTCAENFAWRADFMSALLSLGYTEDEFFNPQLPLGTEWNASYGPVEDAAKLRADYLIFNIASPMNGDVYWTSTYSLWEAQRALATMPERTVVVLDRHGIEGYPLERYDDIYDLWKQWYPEAFIFNTPEEAYQWFDDRKQGVALPRFSKSATVRRRNVHSSPVVLQDGTAGTHPWRAEMAEALDILNVAEGTLRDTNFANYGDAEMALEAEWRRNATILVYGLGDPMQAGNHLSDKALILALRALETDPLNTVVYFDFRDLDGHHLKTMQKMARDAAAWYPDAMTFVELDDLAIYVADRVSQ